MSLHTMAHAQEAQPLSAIDWLSNSIAAPETKPAPNSVIGGAVLPPVAVTQLDSVSPDTVGILPSSVTGLPWTLWAQSDESTLLGLIQSARIDTLPALREMLRVLLLAEAAAPKGADAEGRLFLARVDKLLDMAALQQALALIEAADPERPDLFRRWFDISLLTGNEDNSCASLRDIPSMSPTYPARIFCTARGGDWQAAALILNTGIALGDIDADMADLLGRYLDDHAEGRATVAPDRISPLVFRIFESIGDPLPTNTQPVAFAHADLRDIASWRNRLEAAERLARLGAVDDNVLQAIYTANTPAASGGVWDRAKAFQAFDRAISAGDVDAIATTLPEAWTAMQSAHTELAFARLYGPALVDIALTGDTADLAFRIALLSDAYEIAARSYIPKTETDAFLIGVAQGDISDVTPISADQRVIYEGFGSLPLAAQTSEQLGAGKLGEVILRAIEAFNDGLTGDPSQISQSLATLRAVGLEDVARRSALQFLLLERTR